MKKSKINNKIISLKKQQLQISKLKKIKTDTTMQCKSGIVDRRETFIHL